MLKSTARPMNNTPNATEIRLSEPIASAAKPRSASSPAARVTRIAPTKLHRAQRHEQDRARPTRPTARSSAARPRAMSRTARRRARQGRSGAAAPRLGSRPSSRASRRISARAVAPGSTAGKVEHRPGHDKTAQLARLGVAPGHHLRSRTGSPRLPPTSARTTSPIVVRVGSSLSPPLGIRAGAR